MNSNGKDIQSDESGLFYESALRIKWLTFVFIISGIAASALWLTLFVAGLLVDSSYYRAAISYNFASLNDWLMTFISFTFSNVILLAFMAGLLGGITSKLRATRGFTVSRNEMAAIIKDSKTQIENPFVSAFRGMFVFIAILAMQYVSSFSDLGTISKNTEQLQAATEINYEKLYNGISEKIDDTAMLNKLRSEIQKEKVLINAAGSDAALVSQILESKVRLKELPERKKMSESDKTIKKDQEAKIRSLRRILKVPPNVDFSGIGISSFSYFKFAVIVSFLAFIFGYDSSKFAEFMTKIFKGNKGEKDKIVE